jgi:peptide/nickel transport system permease protein
MIAEGRDFIFQAWWISTLPGVVVVIVGAGLSLIGDGLSQRLGQRQHALL